MHIQSLFGWKNEISEIIIYTQPKADKIPHYFLIDGTLCNSKWQIEAINFVTKNYLEALIRTRCL